MKKFIFSFTLLLIIVFPTKHFFAQSQNQSTEQTKEEKNLKKIEAKENELSKSMETEAYKNFGVNKLYRKGKKQYKKGAYYKALDYFNLASAKAKNKKQQLKVGLLAGNLSLELRDYKLAENHFETLYVINKNHKKFPLIEFQLANAYKYLAKYDTAISLYSKFLKLQSENDKLGKIRRKARLEKKGAVYAQELKREDLDFNIKNAGKNINGSLADFGPELKGDKLFFSKIYTESPLVSKIYYSEINEDKFNVFQDFSETINQNNIQVGNASFSSDGNTVYFSECVLDENFQNQCKIMKSDKIDAVWQKPTPLNSKINLENFSSTQAQITESPNGVERLFFVSNRTRSKGGKDIWYSDIDEEGNFTKAKNLGNPINTSYDEVSPFYHKETNTLYFSSNGHVNIGGFDVFKVENYFQEEDEDYVVKNLDYPINSSMDDYDFILNNKEELGFLSSNRLENFSEKSETCCNDIFVLKATKVDLFVKGLVYAENESSKLKYDNADLFLYDVVSNEKIEEISNNEDGKFIAKIEKNKEYKIVAVSDDFKNEEILFNTLGIKRSDTLLYDIFLKERDFKDFMIGKVYYQYDDSKLREDAPDTLNKVVNFMTIYPDIIVEIASHTDSKGSEEYNLKLSEKRSLAVKNYLINQAKISENRLVNKWYGESKPAVPNTNEDGSDNPKGRFLNRRTEFIIRGTLEKKTDE